MNKINEILKISDYSLTIYNQETLWLADQLMQLVKDEPTADEALKSVTKNLKKAK